MPLEKLLKMPYPNLSSSLFDYLVPSKETLAGAGYP